MKDTILKSLYYQTLFLSEEDRDARIMRTLQSASDFINFIDAIFYTLQNTDFFRINDNRMESLINFLKNILNDPILLIKFQIGNDKRIQKIISTCERQKEENKHKNREETEFFYSIQEMRKRNLLYSEIALPSAEDATQLILVEYPIIESLVKTHELPREKHKIKDILSAMSLLITTYKEILQEDKGLYHYILNYLNTLASSLKYIGHRRRIQAIREQYLALQFPNEEVKLTL